MYDGFAIFLKKICLMVFANFENMEKMNIQLRFEKSSLQILRLNNAESMSTNFMLFVGLYRCWTS